MAVEKTNQATKNEVASKPNRQAGVIFWQILKALILASVVIPNLIYGVQVLLHPDVSPAYKFGTISGLLFLNITWGLILYGLQIYRATRKPRETEREGQDARQRRRIFWTILKAAVMACVLTPNVPISFSILTSPNLDSASKVGSLVGILLFLLIATLLLYGRQIFGVSRGR